MKLDWPNLVVGALIGTIIGLVPSYWFYWKSGKDLEAEAAQLKRLNVIMLRGMEQAGWMKLARDGANNITGIRFDEHAVGGAQATDTAADTLIRADGRRE